MTAAWVAAGAAVVAALVAAKPLHWIIKLLLGTHEFIHDWPKVKADVAELRQQVADIKAETRPNGGSSMHDVIARAASDVADIKHEQAKMHARMEQLETRRAEREGN